MELSYELDKQAMCKDQDMVYADYPEFFIIKKELEDENKKIDRLDLHERPEKIIR